jgi:putative toxin-antitoxin system antitoxin component (TIGR02293 family)
MEGGASCRYQMSHYLSYNDTIHGGSRTYRGCAGRSGGLWEAYPFVAAIERAGGARVAEIELARRRSMMFRIVPEPTYKRRRELLSPEESERTERLARVIATSEYVWDDDAQSRRFLTTSHAALAGKSPLDAASSELGARRVEELLLKILHGLPG